VLSLKSGGINSQINNPALKGGVLNPFGTNQQPCPEGQGMLFSRGGCTQGLNTFLTALKGGVLNPFGTNKWKHGNIKRWSISKKFSKGT
jgi:hypothetical protein